MYAGLVIAGLLLLYAVLSYAIYRRAFVPSRPSWLDDFTFTPFEFQADYEEVELVTADGVNFGAWHFRQPGSPQTVIISGGHKRQRQGADHLRHQGGARAPGRDRVCSQAHPQREDRPARLLDGRGRLAARGGGRTRGAGADPRQSIQRLAQAAGRECPPQQQAARDAVCVAGRSHVLAPDAEPAVGVPSDRCAQLARAPTAVFHPRRRGRDDECESQPPPL